MKKWLLLLCVCVLFVGCASSKQKATDVSVLETKAYLALREALVKARLDYAAQYVYVLVKNENGEFCIAVDGSEEPDDFMTSYGNEIQFDIAWSGTPAYAPSAWNDGSEGICWSAFAPLYDTKNNLVALLGVDNRSPLIKKHPEWNRNEPSWNKIEGKITVNVPSDVQKEMTVSLDKAISIAKKLNGAWASSLANFLDMHKK